MEKTDIYKRFANLQREMKTVAIVGKVDYGKTKYNYITLPTIMEKLFDKLEKYKFGISQPVTIVEGHNALSTIIFDEETGKIVMNSEILLKARTDTNPQDWGASITYFRRYAILSMLGIVGEPDDDAYQSNDTIMKRVSKETNLKSLLTYFESLSSDQQEQFKDLFTNRKEEIKQAQGVQEDILKNVEIK